MTDSDVRTFSLGYHTSAVKLTLNLCEPCLTHRLETGAQVLDKRRPAFPSPCHDCQAKAGILR